MTIELNESESGPGPCGDLDLRTIILEMLFQYNVLPVYWVDRILPQICTAPAKVSLKHMHEKMQYRFAVIYGTLSRTGSRLREEYRLITICSINLLKLFFLYFIVKQLEMR